MKKGSLFPLYFVLFLDNFGFAIIFATFAPLFHHPEYGMISSETSETLRNILLAGALGLFPVGQFFGAPLLGDIADRFGRKKAFYLSISVVTCGFLLSGIAIILHSYVLLLFSRLLTGFFAGNLSICLASIADLSPSEKIRSKNFSFIVIVTGVSWMAAMLMGGLLSNGALSKHFNPALPFFITSVFSGGSLIAIIYFFQETHLSNAPFRIELLKGLHHIMQIFQIKQIRKLYIVYFFWIFGWSLSYQWFGSYAIERYQVAFSAVTWGQFSCGATWIIGGYAVNQLLIKRLRLRTIVVFGTGLSLLCLYGMALAPTYKVFALLMCLACLPAAFSWPNTLSMISLEAPGEIQGKIMGISQSSMSAGYIFATLTGGLLSSLFLQGVYFAAASLLLVSWIILLLKKSSPPQEVR